MFLLLHNYIKALEDVVSSDYRTAQRHDWHNGKWMPKTLLVATKSLLMSAFGGFFEIANCNSTKL